jgi:hypothetical protein
MAATKLLRPPSVASTGMGCDLLELSAANWPYLNSRKGPISLVAAEIHLGRKPAGICDGWLHCNIQIACHIGPFGISIVFSLLGERLGKAEAELTAYSSSQPKN